MPRNAGRTLLVTGSHWYEGSRCRSAVENLLTGISYARIACASGEPTTDSIELVRKQVQEFSPELIIGIGGGSVLDTAKALSGLLALPGSVEHYLEGSGDTRPIEHGGIPWVAVPTTAGTGAEATKNSVIRSSAQGAKRSMRSRFLLAYSAIVDPELTRDLPRDATGISGLDALTQLVEAYVSKKSNPAVQALVSSAFLPHLDALKLLADDPRDEAARSDAAYGALVSGIALANAGLGAAHGFAGGIGGSCGIPHGLICAVFLPHVLAYNAEVIREGIRALVGTRCGKQDPVEWLSAECSGLLRAYGLPADLKVFGVPGEKMDEISRASEGSSMSGNPRGLDEDVKRQFLSALL